VTQIACDLGKKAFGTSDGTAVPRTDLKYRELGKRKISPVCAASKYRVLLYSSDFDDNLAFGTSSFNVSHSLLRCFEGEDSVNNRTNGA
jgi:hypothetical protein